MRLALCNKTLDDRPIEAFFQLASETGFDAVELIPGSLGTPVSDPDPAMRVQVRQVAAPTASRSSPSTRSSSTRPI